MGRENQLKALGCVPIYLADSIFSLTNDRGHAVSKGYGLFKYLSSQVGVMLFSSDQRKPPPPKIASKNLEAILSSRWEEVWKQPSRDEAISCMNQQVALLKQPITHT
jgi:hypothetical protein